MAFIRFLTAFVSLATLSHALTSTFQQVTGFTAGPTAAGMYVYIPTTKLASAPVIVAIHYCTGSAQAYFTGTQYATYADTYGYIVIYPDAPSPGNCWDVASTASLNHNSGGDSQTIVNMVSYAIANYGGDASRVFATGSSSGAMMTNVLAGAYPDVIKAGSVYSGVPDGCFYVPGSTPGSGDPGWSSTCANGFSVASAKQWGDSVRSYYPEYTGAYPKMLIYHGTSDFLLAYANLAEQMKMWSNLLDVAFTQNITNTPLPGYTKMVYGDGTRLVGISALDVGHTVPVRELEDLAWFGLSPLSAPTSSSTVTRSSSTLSTSIKTSASTTSTKIVMTSTTVSVPSPTGTIAHWGQCGGSPWTGSTTCEPPYTCVYTNQWYSQCL